MNKSIVIALCLVSTQAMAQKINASKVPTAVKATFSQNFPSVKDMKWEKEKGNYEANFKDGVNKMSATFTPSGNLMETEKDIAINSLPANAAQYIKSHYSGASIKEAAELTMPDGTTRYEAEVKGMDVIFDNTGTFMKTQKG